MGIKCVILMSFSPLFYVSMFSIYVSMKCNIIVLIIHNISYIYCYFSKVVTETIVNCAIWAQKE